METIARHLGVLMFRLLTPTDLRSQPGLVRISVAATPGNRGSLSPN